MPKPLADIYSQGYTFRKEGYTKIIEYDLTVKQKAQHDLSGTKRPNVMLDQEKTKSKAQPHPSAQMNGRSGDNSEEANEEVDDEGEDVFTDEEEERPTHGQSSLPKSASGKVKTARGRNERVIPPEECRAHLRRLFLIMWKNACSDYHTCIDKSKRVS